MSKKIMTNPVFIVGVSRSGTTLLRSILNLNKSVCIATETHYFDDLRDQIKQPKASELSNAHQEKVENYFLSLAHRPYGLKGDYTKSRIERKDLREMAQQYGGSADAYFIAFCKLSRQCSEEKIWGEKTPRHLFRIEDILSVFPQSKIICMVRDPRAVCASYRDWKNVANSYLEKDSEGGEIIKEERKRIKASYHIIAHALLWKASMKKIIAAYNNHGKETILIQRYEDLLNDPEGEIKKITKWIGVEYDEEMLLNAPIINSTFIASKQKGGIVKRATDTWKDKLSKTEIVCVQDAVSSRLLAEMDYQKENYSIWFVRRIIPWISLPFAVVRITLANRGRMANIFKYIKKRLGGSTSKK